MLHDNAILANKQEYITLLKSTGRTGVDGLIAHLEQDTDFFVAPASTKYHGAFKGGLCAHSLCVYKALKGIYETAKQMGTPIDIPEESLIIAALLHDLSKVNLYKEVIRNKKIYSPNGIKHDEGGNFDWVPVKGYETIEDDSRFIYSNHESTSEFIARQFIPLTIPESVAILHHHGGVGWDSVSSDIIPKIYKAHPLALFLHNADITCAYIFC